MTSPEEQVKEPGNPDFAGPQRGNLNFGETGIAALCAGYFAFYVPFTLLQRMAFKGLLPGQDAGFAGLSLQVTNGIVSLICMLTVVSALRWWGFARRKSILGMSCPFPTTQTFLSGLCTAAIIFTTGLNYAFDDIKIATAALIMRGGVLAMGPAIDRVCRRQIAWQSWVAAGLSLVALGVLWFGKEQREASWEVMAVLSFGGYLAAYAGRLAIMTRMAKRRSRASALKTDGQSRMSYFVEENMTANVVLVAVLVTVGMVGMGQPVDENLGEIWAGFSTLPFSKSAPWLLILGVVGYGIGLFGSLVMLDRRENSFTVAANRVSSVLASFVGAWLFWLAFGRDPEAPSKVGMPGWYEAAGVLLVLAAITFLWHRDTEERRNACAAECAEE